MSTPTPGISVPPARHSRILGVGGCRPRRVVSNAELCAEVDSTPEWIEERSGIRERRFAAPDETLTAMGSAAGAKALARAGIGPEEVGLVVSASMSDLLQTPPLAVRLSRELGATSAGAFDVSGACAGFCHALAVASDAVRLGHVRHALVVGAERMTDIVERQDRTVSVLFADGAGAAVVGPADEPGFGPVVRGADGEFDKALRMDSCWGSFAAEPAAGRPWMRMDGRRVFRWAMETVAPAAATALTAAGVTPDQIEVFVPHQANLRMISLLTERLGLGSGTVVATDVVTSGNTSAASIPLALESLLESGRVRPGALALVAGFGAGLNFAAQVVRLP
ncbi:beta-ketoacyl-ACP synthase 3 [Streptacidiphilus jiangxiensis]|uniref:3-oxoacyl-[acyl-carrier-protein] synthase-3/beta-ketoacyl ACP synthase n=1 Tax=Streptacidiphilus jiangxiensis TaxID=235985 RepID=A0A1H7JLY9_STRJI|nr:beta-ketoacyl-ACP synthase 3 [Streptacidiphilus jiangxiensis]SEK75572.1 3-oxoacyl-[acyl-carrier-protein] synthase-3/beta-ketoacyl ACP synthase [Streptacidiphilus jiangxiensis]